MKVFVTEQILCHPSPVYKRLIIEVHDQKLSRIFSNTPRSQKTIYDPIPAFVRLNSSFMKHVNELNFDMKLADFIRTNLPDVSDNVSMEVTYVLPDNAVLLMKNNHDFGNRKSLNVVFKHRSSGDEKRFDLLAYNNDNGCVGVSWSDIIENPDERAQLQIGDRVVNMEVRCIHAADDSGDFSSSTVYSGVAVNRTDKIFAGHPVIYSLMQLEKTSNFKIPNDESTIIEVTYSVDEISH